MNSSKYIAMDVHKDSVPPREQELKEATLAVS